MRNLLICAHDFPPLGGGGVIRMVKFVKYLPQFEYNPVVMTLPVEQFAGRAADLSSANSASAELTIVRVPTWGVRMNRLAEPSVTQATPAQDSNALNRQSTRSRRMIKSLTSHFRVSQDYAYMWLPNALRSVMKLVEEFQIEAILTTSPPHSCHWLGYAVKRHYGLPWVVDFRDGWTSDPLFQSTSKFRNRIERVQERSIVRNADWVICAAPSIQSDLLATYPELNPDCVELIRNGFDPEDFVGIEEETVAVPHHSTAAVAGAPGPLKISYAGGVGGTTRPIGPLMSALRSLATQDKYKEAVDVTFAGAMPEADRLNVEATPGARFIGFLDHAEAVALMRRSDVLLAIMGPTMDKAISGKTYEYAASGKPTLLLAKEGATKEIVLQNSWGVACDPFDADAIAAALRNLVDMYRSGELLSHAPKSETLIQYDRRLATKRLAQILDTVIAKLA